MRPAIGLLSILGALIAVIFVIGYLVNNAQTGKAIQNAKQGYTQAQQIAGRDGDNRPASETITLRPDTTGGRLVGVTVSAIDAGGAMETYFGLKRGDYIVEIGPLTVKDNMSSVGEARDYLLDAFQKSGSITIIRNEQRLTLPMPNQPAPAPNRSKDPLNQQLDAIQRIPGQ